MKRIVLTGGPGTGKTTLIKYLQDKKYQCFPEVSRQITAEAQKKGIDQLFLNNPVLFSEKVLEGRLTQFKQAAEIKADTVFFDRGLPDVTAYLHYIGSSYPSNFDAICTANSYHTVFIAPPWEAIYKTDTERYESFEECEKIHQALTHTYQKYGYTLITLPKVTVKNRYHFILKTLQQNFK